MIGWVFWRNWWNLSLAHQTISSVLVPNWMEILYTTKPRLENGQPSSVWIDLHVLQDSFDHYTWRTLADGWWKRLGSFALSIPRVKGDFEIWINAFFITSFPTPLWEGLLRFLWWKCSSSKEKDSFNGVLERCLYTISSSSLEKTSELEGYCFCFVRRSCFFQSSISRYMAFSSPCS